VAQLELTCISDAALFLSVAKKRRRKRKYRLKNNPDMRKLYKLLLQRLNRSLRSFMILLPTNQTQKFCRQCTILKL